MGMQEWRCQPSLTTRAAAQKTDNGREWDLPGDLVDKQVAVATSPCPRRLSCCLNPAAARAQLNTKTKWQRCGPRPQLGCRATHLPRHVSLSTWAQAGTWATLGAGGHWKASTYFERLHALLPKGLSPLPKAPASTILIQ